MAGAYYVSVRLESRGIGERMKEGVREGYQGHLFARTYWNAVKLCPSNAGNRVLDITLLLD